MKTRIVRIGNSQGVRIPKLLLERSNLEGSVTLEAQDNQIVIRAAKRPRQDWDVAFRTMAKRAEDELLEEHSASQSHWDEDDWEW